MNTTPAIHPGSEIITRFGPHRVTAVVTGLTIHPKTGRWIQFSWNSKKHKTYITRARKERAVALSPQLPLFPPPCE